MLIPRLVFGACLGALLLVSPAQAAPGWLPPQDVTTPANAYFGAQEAADPIGNAIVVWTLAGAHSTVQASLRPVGGNWEPAQGLSDPSQSAIQPKVAVDGAGNAIAIWQRFNGTNFIIQAAVRPAGGAWQLPAQDLSTVGQHAETPDVAFDTAGNAIAVWSRSNGTNYIIQAAVRPAGGGWTLPAKDLSETGQHAGTPRLAFDGAGNAVAIWRRSNSTHYIVQAATRPAGGDWQLPAQDLSVAGASANELHLGVNAAGVAVAVWERATTIQGAVRPAGGPWELPAQDLSAAGAFDPHAALDPTGNAFAVWNAWNGMNYIVQARQRPAGGAWLPVEPLSEAGESATEAEVATDSAGKAIAVWRRPNALNFLIQAAVREVGGGGWSSPKDLSPSGAGLNAEAPHLVFDAAGNAVVVWVLNAPQDTVQVAPYDAAGPIARGLTVPSSGFARQRQVFAVALVDAWSALGGEPTWRFGDGSSTTGRAVSHTYARRGTYDVSLLLSDVLGNTTTSIRALTLRTARCFGFAATKVGTSRGERMVGTRRADVIVALGGADRIRGRGGNDKICGGKGRDRLAGGAGNDLLNGGPGRDICSQGAGRGRLVSC